MALFLLNRLSALWEAEHVLDRCGVGFFRTSASDPMTVACTWHDKQYVLKDAGQQTLSRKEVDRRFLYSMVEIAKVQPTLKGRTWNYGKAYLYYGIVRAFGGFFW